MTLIKKLALTTLTSLLSTFSFAQTVNEILNRGEIRGNFQIEAQYYEEDSLIGAQDVPEKIRSNAFLNLNYTNGNFKAGLRYESYLNELLGYPEGYGGNSEIMYRYLEYTQGKINVTLGSFYEQFGTGMVLRTYEERGLGYDNALEGVRVKYKPIDGVTLTALSGKQRLFFDLGPGIVRGFDADIDLNSTFSNLAESKLRVQVGGSAVSKFQADEDSRFVLPENVLTYGGRINATYKKFSFSGEYAYKYNDPSNDNDFIFKDGNAIFLQSAYSQKGLGIVLAAKRNDNMSFRSDRSEGIQNLLINYLPALTKQHTYNLLATLYPYATQLNGEMAFQADIIYKFKKGTPIGGKYGLDVQANFSSAHGLDTTNLNDEFTNRQGYTSELFSFGEAYFKDFNILVTKKFNKKIKGRFTYANLFYNQNVIEGKVGKKDVFANVGVADVTYKFNRKSSIRTELQVLLTDQDQGDWGTALVEFSYAPHWFIAVQDQYNFGNSDEDRQIHYYNINAGYNNGGNRISLSYGRQRAGIFCVGGVCRVVPASSGLYLSITSSF